MFSKLKKLSLYLMIAFLSVTFVAGPCFAVELVRGDKAFAGKVTFLQDATAKKNFTVEGSLSNSATRYGNVFYVDSESGANTRGDWGLTWQKPFDTIAYALDQCTANNGDVIKVLPGHTATIIGAGTITLDVDGVTIEGLGNGANRPTIAYTTSDTGTLMITGANITFKNFILNANFADVAMAIDVDAVNFRIEGCLFKEQAANMNFFSLIGTDDTNNAADGLTIINNERISIDAAALAFVSILANTSRLNIIGNFDNQASAADVGHFLILGAFDVFGAQIIGNILNLTGDNNAQTVGIFATGSSTDCTGVMAYNLAGSLDTTTELFDTDTLDFQHFENYHTGTIAKSGTILPVIE